MGGSRSTLKIGRRFATTEGFLTKLIMNETLPYCNRKRILLTKISEKGFAPATIQYTCGEV